MMRTTDERILNPCPICGCSVRVWAKRFDEEDMEYIIECDNDFCGLTYGISCGYNREEIKKAWNSVTALSPTVSDDCISKADLPKKLNGVVLDDCDKIVDEFLEEHECDELWNVVRALRDFYDWTMDAPPVTPINNIQKADTLIIAAALRDFAQDSERNISDRERAGELREQVLAYGASMCQPVTPKVSEDCISRRDALKPFCITSDGTRIPEVDCDNFPVEFSVKDIKRHLLSLPPVTPTERTGEWIENAPEGQGIDPPYICSACGYAESSRTPFCEQCGAKMKG